MVTELSKNTSVIEAPKKIDNKNGIKKESVIESHNIRRFRCWQNITNESVREQKILKPIQGHNWSRFPYKRGTSYLVDEQIPLKCLA